MSYDVIIFDAPSIPPGRESFLAWQDEQAELDESLDFNNPDVLTARLRLWFLEMVKTFPPLNGPFQNSDDIDNDNPKLCDYSLGRQIIQASFGWPEMEQAYLLSIQLAEKYGVGFYDCSDKEGSIWLPSSSGQLMKTDW
ncbi:MAG: hypothetical protein ABI579_04700 [Candidatus Sumerlaeota bacterium]